MLSVWLYQAEEKQRGSACSLPALGGAAEPSSAALLAPDGMGTWLGLNTRQSPPAAVWVLDPFSVALTCVYWRYLQQHPGSQGDQQAPAPAWGSVTGSTAE